MKRQKASSEAELADIEQQIFDLESRFLEEASDLSLYSRAVSGRGRMRGLRSVVRFAKALKRPAAHHRDRVFSLTSATSPAHELLLGEAEDKCRPYFNDLSASSFIKKRRADPGHQRALATLARRAGRAAKLNQA